MRRTVAVVTSVFMFITSPTSLSAASDTEPTASKASRKPYVEGQLLVRFDSNSAAADRRKVRSEHGIRSARSLGRGWKLMDFKPGDELEVLRQLQNDDAVERAELNFVRPLLDHPSEGDWAAANMGVPLSVTASPSTGQGAKVAVLDSGVSSHSQLAGRIASGGWDYVDRDSNPSDPDGHGTAVAGIIAALHDGVAPVGAAPDAQVIPMRVAGPFGASDANLYEAILDSIDLGAAVINLSLGSPFPSSALEEALAVAESAGISVVAAAGNSGTDLAEYPAAYPTVISVGALEQSDGGIQIASFSSFGKVDVAAPGASIRVLAGGGGTQTASGTSFSAPFVSAGAAILAASFPGMTAGQRRHLLLANTTQPDGGSAKRVSAGNGVPILAQALAPSGDQFALRVSTDRSVAQTRTGTVAVQLTNATGVGLAAQAVSLDLPAGWTTYSSAMTTDSFGRATWQVTSGAAPGLGSATVHLPDTTHEIELLSLEIDAELPGVGVTSSPATGTVGGSDPVDHHYVALGQDVGLFIEFTTGGDDHLLVLSMEGEPAFVIFPGQDLWLPASGPPVAIGFSVYAFDHSVGSEAYEISYARITPGALGGLTVSPSVISPNGHASKRATTIQVPVVEPGSLTVSVLTSSGSSVASRTFAPSAGGLVRWRWLAPPGVNGRFDVEAWWESGDAISFRYKTLVVDSRFPRPQMRTPQGRRLFPVPDGYLDRLALRLGSDEIVYGRVDIFKASNRNQRVGSIRVSRFSGQRTIYWNGRLGSRLSPEGWYLLRFIAVDQVGLAGVTSVNIRLSHQKLVTKTAALISNGRAFAAKATQGCSSVSRYGFAARLYAYGCREDLDFAAAIYNFYAPRAMSYVGITICVAGRSYGGTTAAYLTNYRERDLTALYRLGNRTECETAAPGPHMNPSRKIQVVVIALSSLDSAIAEFYVGQVGVFVRYRVLQ